MHPSLKKLRAWLERAQSFLERKKLDVPLQGVAIVLLHAFLRPRFVRLCDLPEAEYQRAFLLPRIAANEDLALFALIGLLPLLIGWRRIGWELIDGRKRTRFLAGGVAAILALTLATLDYNAWYGQVWAIDRLLLCVLAALIWIHPLFVQPFAVLAFLFIAQIHHPLPEWEWHWPDKRLPFDFLVTFVSFLYVRLLTRAGAAALAFATLSLVGGAYGYAVVGKLGLDGGSLDWLTQNRVSHIFVSAYAHGGWLRELGDERILSLARMLGWLDRPIAVVTLFVEGATLATLIAPRIARFSLIGCIVLHGVILLTSGIFFWKWILFDGLLLVWLVLVARDPADRLALARAFGWLPAAIGAICMLLGARINDNVRFAWYDTRLANYFELTGVGQSGKTYRIDPRFFAPYDVTFQQSRFYYLVKRPVLVGTYGVAMEGRVRSALEVSKPDDVAKLRGELGRNFYSDPLLARFNRFVAEFTSRSVVRGNRHVGPGLLRPPYHFQTTPVPGSYALEEPLREVRIELVEVLNTDSSLVTVERTPVETIEIR